MEVSGTGKSPNTSLSFRYNANNEELEEIYDVCEDDPPTPQFDASPSVRSENASPKRGESSSILDKYFRSMRTEKPLDKLEDAKPVETKTSEESHGSSKEVTSSPKKDYLNRLGKRSVSEVPPEVKEPNDTWRLFHDLKFKITQAVDMKSRSLEETKEKSVPRENSISDSEENSVVKDFDLSVGDTDNQVSSLNSSIQNLSDMTQPLTAKASECETPPLENRNNSDSSDDTHKNIIHSYTADITKDYNGSHAMEVESGVEALEDGIDGFADVSNTDNDLQNSKPVEAVPTPPPPSHPPTDCGLPPNKNNIQRSQEKNSKDYFLNFTMYFLSFLLFVNYLLFPNWNIWNGFLMGIWFFCFISNLKQWFLDNYFSETEPFKRSYVELGRSSSLPMNTIPSVREYKPLKKYEGWVNHYRFSDYDPHTYHINKTTTSFMKLEGCNLRISYTRSKIGKRALWDEKIEKVMFYQHRLYNLTGARLILLPKGLVKRRQWSKKYPICIILSEKEKIQVLEKEISAADKKAAEGLTEKKREQMHEMESAETNTSPEKKKKFVWRRREKSISHSDGESGKEGLRHRLVRKMHRDKKTDSVSTCTEPPESQVDKNLQFEDAPFHDAEMEITAVRPSVTSTRDDGEEDLDETELSKIKEFLEETELDTAVDGTSEGEWSLHVKHSKDNHSRLYLFTRTGRDKHEWYRRLNSAILEANATASAEAAKPTTSDDKSTTDTQQHQQECKEGIEMTVYKLSEKDTVAFAKNTTKPIDALLEGLSDRTPLYAYFQDQNYEKTFWPYLFKVIQSKNAPSTCECRKLPAEVTWVNTVLARIIYDVTRNTDMIARLQNRIQRKLHTLKLPSFMSPLMVTELSLAGACPLVERVSAPTWDERGVWLDADMRYDGGAYITILTQINLMKLKEKNISLEDQLRNTNENIFDPDTNATEPGIIHSDRVLMQKKTAAYDSDVEDSAESSSDDESPPLQPVDSNDRVPQSEISAYSMDTQGSSSKKKFLRMVDKIATNKYFQQVTDYKYVKRAMEGLSNTDIKLQLEVHGIEGRLALNLPPPPHDRIWIGFRTNPQLVLKARPAVGARTLRFAHISNWIEQKLTKEFEKVMVLPNMEDIIVEVMTPTQVEYE